MLNINKNNKKIGRSFFLLTTIAIVLSNCSQKKEKYIQAITPPVEAADLAFKKFTINTDSTVIIESQTGSQIKIQPGTFILKNGQPIKGNVDFKFREFHNAYDILRSGIPMSSNQERKDFLQSAGMIELHAYQNNEELNISPDKNIDIQLASYKTSEGYSLYYLDNNINWQTRDSFESKVNVRKQDKLNKLDNIPIKPSEEDSIKDIVFELASNLSETPYLRPFKDLQWKIDEKEVNAKIIEALRVTWDEVSLKELNHRKMKYELTFRKKMEQISDSGKVNKIIINSVVVYATPLLNKKNNMQNRKAFAVQMKGYNEILDRIAAEKIRVSKEADLVNNFRINKMGIWNIDKIQKQENIIFTRLTFDFEKEIDLEINHVKLFVIYEDDNSVIPYLLSEFKKIGIPKDKKISIVAILPKNKLAVVENDVIKSRVLINNENIYLTTNKVDAVSYFSKFDGSVVGSW